MSIAKSAPFSIQVITPPKIPLPAWVPATVGAAALVPMTNKLQDVELRGNWSGETNGISFLRYSGGVYNPYLGDYGAHVIHGGGHATSEDNSVFLANYNTLEFERVGDPTDLGAKFLAYTNPPYSDTVVWGYGSSYGYFIAKGPNSTGWTYPTNAALYELPDDSEVNPRECAPGRPGSAHTYDCLLILPPSMCGDPQGALIRPIASAIGTTAARGTGWSHVFLFSTKAWSRWSNNAYPGDAGNSTVLDTSRNRIWPFSSANRNHSGYLDLPTRAWVNFMWSYPPGGGYPDNLFSAYHADLRSHRRRLLRPGRHHPDLLLHARQHGQGHRAQRGELDQRQRAAELQCCRAAARAQARCSTWPSSSGWSGTRSATSMRTTRLRCRRIRPSPGPGPPGRSAAPSPRR